MASNPDLHPTSLEENEEVKIRHAHVMLQLLLF